MIDNEKYIDRRDGKWLHPCFAETEPMGFDPFCKRILDPSLTVEQAAEAAKQINEMTRPFQPKPADEDLVKVTIKEYMIPGLKSEKDAPEIKVYVTLPKERIEAKSGAVVSPHGGGLCMGNADSELKKLCHWSAEFACVCFSPEYRLSPKDKYPAAINDMEATVDWILENQKMFGIDPERIVVEGISSGGHIAAATTHRFKEKGGFQFCAQILQFPPLDDRLAVDSSNIYFEEVWLPSSDQISMRSWLGSELYCRGDVPPEAVPGHARDFKGLPPAFIHTAEIDHGRGNCIDYARNLMNAGIFVDLHVWGGAYHAFLSLNPETELAQRCRVEVDLQMKDALSGKLVRKF